MVLVFASSQEGELKKAALEAVTYGAKTAATLGTQCVALTIGDVADAGKLGVYGASRVLNVAGVKDFDSQVFSTIINQAVNETGASVVVMADDSTGKSLLGRVAAKLNAGSVSGVKSLPSSGDFKVNKSVYSGKATATFHIKSDKKVVSVMGNTFPPEETGAAVDVENMAVDVPASRIRVKEVQTVKGVVPLPEAELVVSAGRGMKGPENWGIVQELADIIGATTACSRPVADVGWRPHHEHVGQTGVAIRPNLYIAIGISGAIQHLAGVNQSKTIVVINKDPEAPFFKAADYGIVADLFDVVPRLTESIKKHQANS